MNKICLIGRLTKDPEFRENENTQQSTFTLAVSRNYKNADGEYATDFLNCVAWQKLAGTVGNYCKKGDLLGVEGRVQVNVYQDKDGNNKYATNVVVEKITFISSKKEEPKEEKDAFEQFSEEVEIDESELPF